MLRFVTALALIFCLSSFAFADRVPCPKFIADKQTTTFNKGSRYKCYSDKRSVLVAGFGQGTNSNSAGVCSQQQIPISIAGMDNQNSIPFLITRKPVTLTFHTLFDGFFDIDLINANTGERTESLISSIVAGRFRAGQTYIYHTGVYYLEIVANGYYEITID